jgi:hypothetical protein
MSRQITDLAAAGANLFQALIELQRLRASSERKFQRWFFETRADQERAAKSGCSGTDKEVGEGENDGGDDGRRNTPRITDIKGRM